MEQEASGAACKGGRILDLIPKDRLSRYMRAASERWGMTMRLLDGEGEAVLYGEAGGLSGEALTAPIRLRGECIGYLSACVGKGPGSDGHGPAMLSLSASHIEGLAESGYEVESLSAELVRVYEELSLIYGVTARLGAKVEVEDICRTVVDEVDRLLSPTAVMLQLVDEKGGVLRTAAALGEHREKATCYAPGTEEGLVGRAFASHRTVLVCDVGVDRRHTPMPFPVKSLLSVPVVSEGRSIGVITATDKKDESEFGSREEKLVSAIASVAAIAIKNSYLYSEIKGLLEGFISASVLAVESRDPTTAGHSARVALMTVGLAKKVEASGHPPFSGVTFTPERLTELRYACLLHDFGKLGVSESMLLKEAKLYPEQLEAIRARFAYVKERKAKEAFERKLEAALGSGGELYQAACRVVDFQLAEETSELDKFLGLIEAANDPHVMMGELPELARLKDAAKTSYTSPSGEERPLLNPFEFSALNVLRGSLTDNERREVERHVTHSYNFMVKIPWTRGFSRIADIVHAHHEKLDGSGYPLGLTAEQIPLEAKMMAVADIFDALTAWDRPYKKAVSTQKALFILEMEASAGKLEPHLVQIFRDEKVYECALGLKAGALHRADGG